MWWNPENELSATSALLFWANSFMEHRFCIIQVLPDLQKYHRLENKCGCISHNKKKPPAGTRSYLYHKGLQLFTTFQNYRDGGDFHYSSSVKRTRCQYIFAAQSGGDNYEIFTVSISRTEAIHYHCFRFNQWDLNFFCLKFYRKEDLVGRTSVER